METSDESATVRPKTALFCQECGHESPVDGDWERESVEAGHRYACPECETTITTRRRSVPLVQ